MTEGQGCRLLFVTGQLRAGGLERQLYYLLQIMDRERYRPAVVVWNLRQDDIYFHKMSSLGIPLYGVPRDVSPMVKLARFRHIVRQLNPELIHSYTFYTNFAAAAAAWGSGAVAVGSVRGDFLRARREAGVILGRLSSVWPRHQVFNNLAAMRTLEKKGWLLQPRQIVVVRNGVDLDRFPERPMPKEQRPRIVGMGSLIPVKRWDRLLEAALQLKRNGRLFQLEIAGNGPLRESLESQIQANGLADCVRFVGHVADVSSFLSCARLLAHVSDSEGCPNVVMEAMACGRPVVAMSVGDIPALVDDGRTGFLIDSGDLTTFVKRVEQLICDFELCQAMGRAARDKAVREFSLARLLSETLRAYRAAGWTNRGPR